MFSAAYRIASKYTFPVIISSRQFNGECQSGMGAFVLINENGWFVTALHIITSIQQLAQSNQEYNDILALRKNIENDTSLKPGERQRRLNSNKIPGHLITEYYIWWGGVETGNGEIDFGAGLSDVDLAIGHFKTFVNPPSWISPKFKDPSMPMDPGTSLCKLGYPLHEIKPSFDENSKNFVFPAGAIPVPFFPLDGILTRMVNVESQTVSSFPQMFIETSTPGLLGQSGGPTFDVNGTIWAIQSQTMSYPLGFGQNHKGPAKQGEFIKNQYLNVGWGIHSLTITSFLRQHNVAFELST